MCQLAILKSGATQHEQRCKGLEPGTSRCLVCAKIIEDNDMGWKTHLLTSNCRNMPDKM